MVNPTPGAKRPPSLHAFLDAGCDLVETGVWIDSLAHLVFLELPFMPAAARREHAERSRDIADSLLAQDSPISGCGGDGPCSSTGPPRCTATPSSLSASGRLYLLRWPAGTDPRRPLPPSVPAPDPGSGLVVELRQLPSSFRRGRS